MSSPFVLHPTFPLINRIPNNSIQSAELLSYFLRPQRSHVSSFPCCGSFVLINIVYAVTLAQQVHLRHNALSEKFPAGVKQARHLHGILSITMRVDMHLEELMGLLQKFLYRQIYPSPATTQQSPSMRNREQMPCSKKKNGRAVAAFIWL